MVRSGFSDWNRFHQRVLMQFVRVPLPTHFQRIVSPLVVPLERRV
jgi:hypothetical protein